MRKLALFMMVFIILSTSTCFAALLDVTLELPKDFSLPYSDLQEPVIVKRTGEQKRRIKDDEPLFTYNVNINEILKATKLKFIEGYEDGTFRPNNNITRAEFIKLVVLLAVNRNFDFGTIPHASSHWAAKYIAVAEMQNIIEKDQYMDSELDEPITRIEMICILSNTQIKMKGVKLVTDAILPAYTDIGGLSDEEKALLTHALKYELVSDMFNVTEIRPYDNLTRGEAARAIMRIY